jgi:two-component system cell cycle response regulator
MAAKILAVEDNPANLDLITYLLRAFGHDVESRMDGISGLEATRTGGYDLVLADVLMPGLDGYEFAHRFKADPRLASTPLVAVTALAMAGDKEKIIAAGFDGYISKPIDPQKFAEQIESFLARSKRGKSSHH